MSDKLYIEYYDKMTAFQKDVMADLYMEGVNRDGHVWVKWCDIESMIGRFMRDFYRENKDKSLQPVDCGV